MTDLPPDREKALERIAAGWGREATAAHPDCICGKPTGKTSTHWVTAEGEPAPLLGDAKDCPMHRGGRR